MAILLIAIFFVRIAEIAVPGCSKWLYSLWQKIKKRLTKQKPHSIFEEHFIEVKSFYLREFKILPCIVYIGNIDTGKIFDLVKSGKYVVVTATYQRNWYNWQLERLEFSKTILHGHNTK